jgi:drug/metabolite transporter (DMT)-like permease
MTVQLKKKLPLPYKTSYMSTKNSSIGIVLVALGASSYGMLATFVKLAYQENFTTAEVTSAQFIYGLLGMLLLNVFQRKKLKNSTRKATTQNIFQLMLAGTSMGMTSVFYYLAVRYIPVSIGIVLLMQTVWMGVLLEWLLDKKKPSIQKTIAVFVVLIGTLLAINIFNINFNDTHIDWAKGSIWGLLAAASFTTTMFTANKIALEISAAQRSLFMLFGGGIIVFGFAIFTNFFQMGNCTSTIWHHHSSDATQCRVSLDRNRTWKYCFVIRITRFSMYGLFAIGRTSCANSVARHRLYHFSYCSNEYYFSQKMI